MPACHCVHSCAFWSCVCMYNCPAFPFVCVCVCMSSNSLCDPLVCQCCFIYDRFIRCRAPLPLRVPRQFSVCMCPRLFSFCTSFWHTLDSCVRVCVCVCLWGHAVDKAPQLLDHSLYEFLFIPVVLPELWENVVLLTGVLHPTGRGTKRDRNKFSLCWL